jgi:hypothetical protein
LLALSLAALWGAIWWRMRGGAFTAITHIGPGTGGMRAIAAVALGAPLMVFGYVYALIMPALWLSWTTVGWGAFQGMGADPIEAKNPVASGLVKLGVRSPLANCLIGMALEGVLCMVPLALVTCFTGFILPCAAMMSGVMFSPLYFLAQRSPWRPNLGPFAKAGSEWGEVLVGAWVAFVITGVVTW